MGRCRKVSDTNLRYNVEAVRYLTLLLLAAVAPDASRAAGSWTRPASSSCAPSRSATSPTSPAGRVLLGYAGNDGVLMDTRAGNELGRLTAHTTTSTTRTSTGTAASWPPPHGRHGARVGRGLSAPDPVRRGPRGLRVQPRLQPDGRTLATSGSGDNLVKLWETLHGKLLRTFRGGDASPRPTPRATARAAGTCCSPAPTGPSARWTSGAATSTCWPRRRYVQDVAFSRDGRLMAAPVKQRVTVWKVEAGRSSGRSRATTAARSGCRSTGAIPRLHRRRRGAARLEPRHRRGAQELRAGTAGAGASTGAPTAARSSPPATTAKSTSSGEMIP